MAMWLYQLTQAEWPVNSYRLDIWEGERWRWPVGKIAGAERPAAGDRVVFYFAKAGCDEPGFYGWAIVLQWEEAESRFYFRPVAPSDQLKMCPWWDDEARRVADAIRGPVPRGTLWPVGDDAAAALGAGLARWVNGCAGAVAPAAAQPSTPNQSLQQTGGA
jgi:hypothetical protein